MKFEIFSALISAFDKITKLHLQEISSCREKLKLDCHSKYKNSALTAKRKNWTQNDCRKSACSEF